MHCSKSINGNALLYMSLPMIFVALILQISMFITIIYVGRLDSAIYLAAATIGMTICNMTGYSILYGSCTALDSLVSQAYGAKSYRLMGLHCQRAIVILSIASLIIICVWLQTEFILYHLLGIDSETSHLAGQWASMYAIGMWPNIIYEIMRKFLQCQQIVWPIVLSSLLAALTNLSLTYVLVHMNNLGFMGCATGLIVSQWVSCLALLLIIITRKHFAYKKRNSYGYRRVSHGEEIESDSLSIEAPFPSLNPSKLDDSVITVANTIFSDPLVYTERHCDTSIAITNCDIGTPTKAIIINDNEEEDPEDNWPPITVDIFRDWGPFLRLGLPSALSLLIEWGSYEGMAVIAGQLGTESLAAHGIFSVVATFVFMTPFAIATSSATLTGNLLGEGRPEDAWHMILLGLGTDLIVGIGQGALALVLGNYWCPMFTKDADVIDMLRSSLPVFAFYIVADNTMCGSATILRNTGNPGITVWANGVACLVFMLPIGYLLAVYTQLGLKGPWIAMAGCWSTLAIIFTYVLATMNWQLQAINAQKISKACMTSSISTESDLTKSISSVQTILESFETQSSVELDIKPAIELEIAVVRCKE